MVESWPVPGLVGCFCSLRLMSQLGVTETAVSVQGRALCRTGCIQLQLQPHSWFYKIVLFNSRHGHPLLVYYLILLASPSFSFNRASSSLYGVIPLSLLYAVSPALNPTAPPLDPSIASRLVFFFLQLPSFLFSSSLLFFLFISLIFSSSVISYNRFTESFCFLKGTHLQVGH